jgi:biopolymer transport protein ExbB
VRSNAFGVKNANRSGRRAADPMLECGHFYWGAAYVWELVKAGGWMMLPIILSSIVATAIVAERLWTLRASRVSPPHLLGQVWRWIKEKKLNGQKLTELRASSPLGEVLAAGLANSKHGREIMKECIEEAASRVVHELERYLNALGSIAAMAPLLGLLGTVFGMIQIFSGFMDTGMTNTASLAGGIGKALITTAAGLLVAIPAVFFHRYLLRRVDELVVTMEQEAIKLVEVVQGDREVDFNGEGKA